MNLETRHEPVKGYEGVRVEMVRDHLEDIPVYEVPEGYSVRWYEPGDQVHWMRIHLECEGYAPLRPDLFWEQYGRDEAVMAERIAFVCDSDGVPVATNSAWMNDWNGKHWGRVHWVATCREAQGKGLSKPLMTVVMERLRDLGHDRVHLTTNTARARAIALYGQFGFKAYWETEKEKDGWETLLPKLEALGKRIEVVRG